MRKFHERIVPRFQRRDALTEQAAIEPIGALSPGLTTQRRRQVIVQKEIISTSPRPANRSKMSRLFLALSLVFAVVFSTDIKTEDGVLVLTASNFDNALETNEHVLVEFYAPWCGHCKALAPHYAKAAEKLAEMNSAVKLAKVDATIETSLSEKYNIRGYPTLKYFHAGKVLDYPGVRQTEDIVNWLLKKSGPSAKDLSVVIENRYSFFGGGSDTYYDYEDIKEMQNILN